jgi:hypothetical protein
VSIDPDTNVLVSGLLSPAGVLEFFQSRGEPHDHPHGVL